MKCSGGGGIRTRAKYILVYRGFKTNDSTTYLKKTLFCSLVHILVFQPFPKGQILDSSNLKEVADDNFEFDENWQEVVKTVKHCGKRRNCSLRAISPFPTVFKKACTADT